MGDPAGSQPSAATRLVWLDALRGLAVIGVITIHVLAGPLLFPSRYSLGGLGWLTFLDAMSRFSVPLFVIASGLLLTLSHRRRPLPYPEFLRRRAWRVVPAYLFWSAIYTALQHESPDPIGFLGDWLRHSLVGDASFHTWFVPVILHLYLVLPLLADALARPSATRRRAAWLITLLVVFKLAMTVRWFGYGFLDGLPPLMAAYLRNGPLAALEWSPYFLIGVAAAAWFQPSEEPAPNLRWVPRLGGIAVLLAVLLRLNDLLVAADGDHAAHWGALGWSTTTTPLAALGGVAALGKLLQRPQLTQTVELLARLGSSSYGLYLAHVLVLQSLNRQPEFQYLSSTPETAAAAVLVVLLPTMLLVGAMARVPGLRALSGVDTTPST